jgi:hypothetical protein
MGTSQSEVRNWEQFRARLDRDNRKLLKESGFEAGESTFSTGGHPYRLSQQNINLKNIYNFQYYGPIYMGSAAKELFVSYDTGSDVICVGLIL